MRQFIAGRKRGGFSGTAPIADPARDAPRVPSAAATLAEPRTLPVMWPFGTDVEPIYAMQRETLRQADGSEIARRDDASLA
jgi:hypothetical protein